MRKIINRRSLLSVATVRVPVLVEASDYHDFGHWEDIYRKLDPKLHCVEIGTVQRPAPDTTYLGVIYLGHKPSKETLQALVSAKQFTGEVELS